MNLVQAPQTGLVQSTFSLTGTQTCSNSNAFLSSHTVGKGFTRFMDSQKSGWMVSARIRNLKLKIEVHYTY